MQHEFDNTFEALLRRAATRNAGEVLPENAEHLDPDSISAFVENVLPTAAHARFAAHLADCSDCRKILASFALMQEAEEAETIEEKAIVPAKPTWSERFALWFALPNLGYAAAALAVLLIGVFGFIAFQSKQKNSAPEIAQVEPETEEKAEQRRRAARPAAQPEPPAENTPQTQPTETPNESDLNNANLADNANQQEDQSPNRGLPPSYRIIQGQTNNAETTARRETPEPTPEPKRTANVSNNSSAANANTLASASPQPTPAASAKVPNGGTVALAAPNAASNSNTANKANEQETKTADQPKVETQRSGAAPAATLQKPISARVVNGKKFQNLDGVWRDEFYSGQKTENVSRGSDEYKKLDGGLHSIADSFKGETVIIVWQGKAYKIH